MSKRNSWNQGTRGTEEPKEQEEPMKPGNPWNMRNSWNPRNQRNPMEPDELMEPEAGQGSQGLLPRGEKADSHGAPEWDQGGHTH